MQGQMTSGFLVPKQKLYQSGAGKDFIQAIAIGEKDSILLRQKARGFLSDGVS